jgi:hypothetical protein
MAKKVASKTSKKSKTSAKSTSKTSKTKKAKVSKNTTKTTSMPEAADFKDLFYGTMSAIAVYIFALWAIDSGSLWVYALTFAALYYTVHFYRLFIRNKFFNNDKTRKAKPAKN